MKKYLFVCLFLWLGSANSTPIVNDLFPMDNSLNSNIPNVISLERIVNVISTDDVLRFDYHIGWTIVGRGAPPNPVGRFPLFNALYGTNNFGGSNSYNGFLLSGSNNGTPSSSSGARLNYFLTDPQNVQLGNMPVSAVPIPATVWLVGTGLLGLMGIKKSKPKISA